MTFRAPVAEFELFTGYMIDLENQQAYNEYSTFPKKRGGFGQVSIGFRFSSFNGERLSVRGTSHQLHKGSRCGGASRGWCFAEFPAYL